MSKRLKKMIAVLSAIALVIGSVTIYQEKEVKAEASADDVGKYEINISGTAITAGEEVISVEGFQIQANSSNDNNSVNFRTVCKSLKAGEKFEVDGQTYTVKGYGTVYAIDYKNTSGDHNLDELDVTRTLLNTELKKDRNGNECYEGLNTSGEVNVTYGYEATSMGVMDGWDLVDENHTYYSRTMYGMDEYMANSIYVRAFIITEEGDFIYSVDTATISVAEIAEYLYEHNMAKNVTAHKYLYDSILSTETLRSAGHKSYRETEIEYGWDDNLFKKNAELVNPNNQ